MPGDSYSEQAAPRHATMAVACVWEHRGSTDSRGHLVAPDNCADILLSLAPDGTALGGWVVGVMTAPVVVPGQAGHLVGLRFRPGWLAPVIGVSARELRDRRVDLRDVAPAWVRALHGPAPASQFLRLTASRVLEGARPTATVQEAVAALTDEGDRVSVEALCRRLRVSRQHLTRVFNESVGTGPKFVARVARMERVRRELASRRGDWARLAAESGFSDQAHLAREMRTLSGQVPSAFQ